MLIRRTTRIRTKEHNKKISESNKNKRHKVGNRNHNFHKTQSPEIIEKIRQSNRLKWLEWNSLGEEDAVRIE